MHPAYSVIFFTVASGAGFGLLAWLGLAPLFGASLNGAMGWAGFILAFGLSVAGLVSSTFHLGHPERAWRALTQVASSWLSREGVLAIVALAMAGLYALGALFFSWTSVVIGLTTTALALATVYATAMIYAQLRTVRRWNTDLTVACYLLFSLAGGALLMGALHALFAPGATVVFAVIGLVLLVAAWAVKLLWWRRGDDAPPLSTPESATGLGHLGKVRMLESPHTSENYLLSEMGYQIARKHRDKLRILSAVAGGAVPAFALLLSFVVPGAAGLMILAVLFHLGGMLAERWLFFAEAEHAVTTYYQREAA